MKLESLKVDGFKSLVNTSLSSIANLNMLYGYNNSGKSNILKFIELIFRAKKQNGDSSSELLNFWDGIVENASFVFNANTNNDTISFEFRFKVQKSEIQLVVSTELYTEIVNTYFVGNNHDYIQVIIKGEIKKLNFYSAQIKLINVKVNARNFYGVGEDSNPIYLGYVADDNPNELLLEYRFDVFQSVMSLFTDSVLLLDNDRYFGKEKTEFVKYGELSPRNFNRWLYSLSMNPETHSIYKELFVFISKFKVTLAGNPELKECEANSPFIKNELSFSQSQDELFTMFESNGKRLPISNFGTGIQQIFYILAKIFSSNAKIILIEEIELNLSPKYQAEILKHLKELIAENKISQVFFTTHSKYFNFRNDFSIYEVRINSDGETTSSKMPAVRKSFFAVKSLE